ncbi:efflux RND transporter periplasmic adaptor subunit [Acinetobacter sp.]|uniref:efflux RND transporter periplasmic adaptor subunit n=1 Tax=Acinetobacter sp. TaxID=472 RepID=UPI002828E248|nr:efflux RND transporter periplasmic adaptor subunit [Acinetobacter sp.]MDR2248597.1 efflux RND transporter periplasmic adaptor subunit [Acinetobacter sp.]
MKEMKKTSPFKKIVITLIVILLAGFSVLFFLFPKENKEPETYVVKRGDITEVVKATGEVYALQLVDVGAQVSGQIRKLNIRLGQRVQKGDLIAEIDSTTQINELNTSKAKLEAAKALLESKQISVQVAKKHFDRTKIMFNADATSKESVEAAEDNYKQAKSAVDDLIWNIKQIQIALNTAQTNMAYTQIRSPLTGTVVSLPVEAGQTINFAQTTPLIAKIANLDQMEIRMQIPEGDYTKIKIGMPVNFSTLSDPNEIRTNKIYSIDPALTSLTKGTYTSNNDATNSAVYYYTRMIVPNIDRKLSIGMTTQNNIIINHKKSILMIPKLAIYQSNLGTTVRIQTELKKIENRQIKTGISDNNNIEVTSGLKLGEKVILELPETETSGVLS